MSSIKSLSGVLLAAAVAMAACGSGAAGGQGGDAADRPPEQASGEGGERADQPGEPKRDGNGGDEGDEPGGARENTIEVRVVGGRVEGVEDAVDVSLGESVTIRVRSDVADEVHVHGYDLVDDVGPGEEAEIELTTDIPGAFEVELEEARLLLFELRVQ
jgi:hypothetical protein